MDEKNHNSYLLPFIARIMAGSEADALKAAHAAYDASEAVRHAAQANGSDVSVVLLNYREDEIELVGAGLSEDARSEARTALIDAAGIDNVNRIMIERCASLVESTREVIAGDDAADPVDTAIQTVDGVEFSYHEALALAMDSPEVFHCCPESGGSIMSMLEETLRQVLRVAVVHCVSGDKARAEEKRERLEDEAGERGREAARAAAGWAADGNSDVAERRRVLEMMRAGDPAADDYIPRLPDLSGEVAGDLTPVELARELTGEDDPEPELIDALAEAWGDAVSEEFGPAVERELIRFVAPEPVKCPGHADFADCEDDPQNPCRACIEAGDKSEAEDK